VGKYGALGLGHPTIRAHQHQKNQAAFCCVEQLGKKASNDKMHFEQDAYR